MSLRLEYAKASPEIFRKFSEFSMLTHKSTISTTLRDLINIRASQVNGCAFCVDMHHKEAIIHGERPLRLFHIVVWRESELFDARERAAFEWTEALTHLPPHGVPQEIFDRVHSQFSAQEITDLTFLVVAINGWNRLAIGFTAVPGSMDQAYGLTKANLS